MVKFSDNARTIVRDWNSRQTVRQKTLSDRQRARTLQTRQFSVSLYAYEYHHSNLELGLRQTEKSGKLSDCQKGEVRQLQVSTSQTER